MVHAHIPGYLNPAYTPSGSDSDDSIHGNEAGELAVVSLKITPAGADSILIEDSASANEKKRILVSSVGGGGGSSQPCFSRDISSMTIPTRTTCFAHEPLITGTLTIQGDGTFLVH